MNHSASNAINSVADEPSPAEKVFRLEYCAIARAFYAFGADDAALAEALSVDIETLESWRSRHAEFATVCEAGKDAADEAVERALVARCNGYYYDAEKPAMRKGEGFIISYRAYIPPDVSATEFLLLNRKPREWKTAAKIPLPEPENPYAKFYREHLLGTALRPHDPRREQREAAAKLVQDE
jgi:hypothetical protein